MRGVWKKAEFASICFMLAAVFCYYFGIGAYVSMENTESAVIYLSASYPDRTEVVKILEECQEAENPVDICFYWDGGLQRVENKNYKRSSKVLVAGLTGDASLYHFRGSALNEEDRRGCIIDKKTALELFGSADCIGSTVNFGGEQYEIRQVVLWKHQIMIIHPTKKDTVYTRVFVRVKKGESLQNASDRFLMSYGLNGSLVDDEWLLALALIALLFFPAGLVVMFFKAASKRKKAAKDNKGEYWLWQCVMILGAGILLVLIYKNFHISSDWLPDKWSNFEFWLEKIKKERENLDLYLMLPKTVPQIERIWQAVKSMLGGIFALVLYLCAGKSSRLVA